MGRKGGVQVSRKQAQRRLDRTQRKLRIAEEKLAQAMTQGQQIVDRARLKADQLRDKAAARVAKQLARLEQLEARLAPAKPAESIGKNGREQADQEAVSVGTAVVAPSDSALPEREQRVLEALRASAGPEGLSGGAWQAVTQLPKTTFARARARLLAEGLVKITDGPMSHPRYVPVEEK
jgi:hypothetical protein